MKLSIFLVGLCAAFSLAQGVELEARTKKVTKTPSCVAVDRNYGGKFCGKVGTVKTWDQYEQHTGQTIASCANECACKDVGKCKAFSFKSGTCTLYNHDLHHMKFKASKGGAVVGETFYDRACYRRAKPTSTGAMTAGPKPTGYSKRDPVEDLMVEALAGI